MHKPNTKLVAHRGYSREYPENSYTGILAALQKGAVFVEFDVHLSKNRVPYVIHDSDLKRTTGQEGVIYELSSTDLREYKVAYTSRFRNKFSQEPLPSLANIVELLSHWPHCQAFVEVKRASISCFGIQSVYESLRKVIEPILKQTIIISFDLAFVQYAKQQACTQVAWVFDDWDNETNDRLFRLQPEYVFTDWECVPVEIDTLWAGNWQWVIYEIDDPLLALHWMKKGADLIETNDIENMQKSLIFSNNDEL